MAFRDDRFAHDEREKTELRDEVRELRDTNKKLSQELAEERRKDEEEAAEKALVNSGTTWKERLGDFWSACVDPFIALGRWIARMISLPFIIGATFISSLSLIQVAMVLSLLMIAGSVFLACWHEFEDPRDGYVTGENYYPEHQECGWEEHCTGSGDSRRCHDDYECHTVPPRWTVDIGYQGQGATWDVEQEDYNRVQRGQWFCARDLLHDAPCVEPQQP